MLYYWYLFANATLIGLVAAILGICDNPPVWMTVWCMLLLLATVIFIVINRRKYPVELTDEERRMPAPANMDYSNSLDWKHVLLFNINIAYSLIVLCFLPPYAKYIIAGDFAGMWTHVIDLLNALPVAWWMLGLICFVLPTCIMFRQAGNRYILEGDVLIVRERNLFRREEELRIPIASISGIYIKNRWSLRPFLFFEVDGVPRQLFATTHTLELAVALLQRKAA